MILWKIYNEHDKQHYVVLTYENSEPIKPGDAYVCHFEHMPWLCTCWSDQEAKECNEPINAEGIVVGGRNHYLRCYKVHSVIKTDSEWYAPFYATIDPDLGVLTIWRADTGQKPIYKDDRWVVADYNSKTHRSNPDFSCVSDMELAAELEVSDPNVLYTIECNAIDWFLENDYAIDEMGGNYNWED